MNEQEIHEALLLWRFQHEVKRQCDFCLKAFRELDAAVRSCKDILGQRLPYEAVLDEGIVEGSEEDHLIQLMNYEEEQAANRSINEHGTAIWFCLQNMLVSLANMSKLLWPTQNASKFSQSIKQQFRTSLDVGEDTSLKSRTCRNHFEHFDERLERWATSTASNMFVDSVILTAPSDLLDPQVFNPGTVFRHYDPQSNILTFQQISYHLQPVFIAVQTLGKKADAKADENPLLRLGFRELCLTTRTGKRHQYPIRTRLYGRGSLLAPGTRSLCIPLSLPISSGSALLTKLFTSAAKSSAVGTNTA